MFSLRLTSIAIAVCLGGSQASAQVVSDIQYVDYGTGYKHLAHKMMNQLDLYWPSSPASSHPPILLLFHGGGFVSGQKKDVQDFAKTLSTLGYFVANANYRMADQGDAAWGYPWPAAYDDAEAAVRWIKRNAIRYGIDASRIVSIGISAGATVAAHLGVSDRPESKVKAVISLAGRMDFTRTPIGSDPRPYFLPNGNYPQASPISHVNRATAPFLFFHGWLDRQVEIEHSRMMSAKLRQNGIVEWRIEGPVDHDTVFQWVMNSQLGKISEFLSAQL